MRSSSRLPLLLCLCVWFSFVVLTGVASAEGVSSPGWGVTAVSYPTVLAPGGSGELNVEVFNVGGAPSVAGATLTDVLPAHLTAVSGKGWECSGSTPEVCTLSLPSVLAGSQLLAETREFAIYGLPVLVGPGAGSSGPEVNRVTVAGGGAPAAANATDTVAIGSTAPGFGIADWDGWYSNADGMPDTQAGSHPYEATFVLDLNAVVNGGIREPAGGELRSAVTALPAGLVANPDAAALCSREAFNLRGGSACPSASQVGVANVFSRGVNANIDIYNLVPPKGIPAQFGFTFEGIATFIDGSVRSGSDYGIDGDIEDIVQEHAVQHAVVTLWGDPAESNHDPERCALIENEFHELKNHCGLRDEGQSAPFLTLPTSCGGELSTGIAVREWENPAALPQQASFQSPAVTGCQSLAFAPGIELAPDTSYADTPAGLSVDVNVAQEGLSTPEGLSQADIQNTTVALPAGVVINPGQAAGLASCPAGRPSLLPGQERYGDALTSETEKRNGEEDSEAPYCPKASKVGEVRIKTPLLENAAEKELVGNVYVMQSNPPNLKLLVAASGDGVNIKLVGDVSLCENTGEVIAGPGPVADRTCAAPGQLITKFTETPELPFTDFKLTFSGGAQAALATPTQCGSYTTTADFESWANPFIDEIFPTSEFQITNGPGGGSCSSNPLPFSPELIAGSTTDQAGGFTNFSLLLQRGDGQQRIDGLQFKAPAGLTGELSKVPLCTNAQAETNTCPEASKIGHTVVESGPGPYPLVVPEPGQEPAPIYLTGPYNGSGACTPGEPGCAPFGLSIVVPLHVGPFTLQTQRVRAKIELNPLTAALTVTTNPLPQVVDGVPTDLREVDSVIERPEFMINPTNCNSSQFSGTAYGTQPPGGGGDFTGQPDIAAPISSHFGVGACQALKFEPKISVSTSGKTSKTDGASLTYKVAYPNTPQGTQSDIRYVKVELPGELPSRLTTLQKACTAAQFDANPAGCPVPSVIGHAVVHTQLLPVPLEGPVYFVSNGGEAFPNLEMVLQGDGVTVDLIGDTLIKNGVTSTTFKAVPDQPFQTFEITLPEGPYSALAANGDLCKPTVTETVKKKVRVRVRGHERTVTRKVKEQVAAALTIPSEYIGQNGAPYKADVPISVTGCPKAVHPDKVKKKAHRKGKKAK
jgi:hypothetical protein